VTPSNAVEQMLKGALDLSHKLDLSSLRQPMFVLTFVLDRNNVDANSSDGRVKLVPSFASEGLQFADSPKGNTKGSP